MSASSITQSLQKPKLLAVSDICVPTGLARVHRNILESLTNDFDISVLASNYHGEPHSEIWPIYPASNGGDLYGFARLKKLVDHVRPQIVFLYNDLWVIVRYLAILREVKLPMRIVVYCPIDGGPVDCEDIPAFIGVSAFVVCTKFAANMVDSASKDFVKSKAVSKFPKVEIIPHHTDTDSFFPLSPKLVQGKIIQGKSLARKVLFPQFERPDALFIFLNANRNQPRKCIDTTIAAFALFAKNKPDTVKLYLHMGSKDIGWDIVRLARRYGIEDRLLMSTLQENMVDVPNSQLNLIYNACDVGLNTAASEGWGLIAFEHAATGAAQIIPAHTACKELWQGHAVLVEPKLKSVLPHISAEYWLLDPQDVAEAMEKIYSDRYVKEELSAGALANARSAEYQPSMVGKKWTSLFMRVLKQPARQLPSSPACC